MAASSKQPHKYGLLGQIFSSIFGGEAKASPAQSTQPQAAEQSRQTGAPANANAQVDVAKILEEKNTGGQKLNWKTSIVDLLKLLDLDSSLEARKSLADELHYSGDKNDSAAMNVWLHKQVMLKLKENGGKLPDDLKN